MSGRNLNPFQRALMIVTACPDMPSSMVKDVAICDIETVRDARDSVTEELTAQWEIIAANERALRQQMANLAESLARIPLP